MYIKTEAATDIPRTAIVAGVGGMVSLLELMERNAVEVSFLLSETVYATLLRLSALEIINIVI